MSVFAIRLKELMKEKGLFQKDLADKFEYSQQTVSRWCQGVTEPDYETLIKLCKMFDVSSDYLLGISDDF